MRETIPPLPRYAFMAWFSVKAEGQLDLLPLLWVILTSLPSVFVRQTDRQTETCGKTDG